ncbi:cysteine-rich protein 1 isoform X2 [Bos indicus x Bos taurus]|uniref:cysteine-rich protein 1 isoform X2 n=1 Tax=Bos indicus x Bos taurus TaxID=30522 RepID=UPI000F7D4494|nr:cysteine-rich protein 1 isoform X2 [Bos indicus x Bos taurus]
MLRRAQSLGRRVEASGLAGEGQGQGPLCMAWGGRLCSSEGRTPLEGSSAAAGAEPCSTSSPSAWSPAERVTSLGKDWHRPCLKCEKCGKTLTSGGHAEHEGKPYCNHPCYAAMFGPKGFGRGGAESHTFK